MKETIMSDKEIEQQVRENNKDLPDGMYDTGYYLTGRDGIIEFEIAIMKYIRYNSRAIT